MLNKAKEAKTRDERMKANGSEKSMTFFFKEGKEFVGVKEVKEVMEPKGSKRSKSATKSTLPKRPKRSMKSGLILPL